MPSPTTLRLLLPSILACLTAIPIAAADIHADGVACSLADAMLSAQNAVGVGGCAMGSPGLDRIVLDYDVVLGAPDTTHSANTRGVYAGLPKITTAMILEAGVGSTIERDASLGCDSSSTPFRLLQIGGGAPVTLRGLTLENGCAASSNSETDGGAILVKGSAALTLDGCTLSNNTSWAGKGFAGRGGAVAIRGSSTLTVLDSTFSGNLARGTNRTSGSMGDAYGGAVSIYNSTLDRVTTSVFRDNEARGARINGSGAASKAFGGGLSAELSPVTTIEQTLFENNRALGGDTPAGNAGNGRGAGFYANDSDVVMLRHNAFVDNLSQGGDGSKSGQGSGGGLHISGSGSLGTLTSNTFERNVAISGSGTSNSVHGKGGGVYLVVASTTITQNTFFANAVVGGDHLGAGSGGNGTGGGLRTTKAVANLSHNTFHRNTATGGLGIPYGLGLGRDLHGDGATITGSNNIFWSGHPTDQDVWTTAEACAAGAWVSNGYNLVDVPGTCDFGSTSDVIGSDPLLADHRTSGCSQPLLDGRCPLVIQIADISPALDQGSCATSGASVDARGVARPYDELTAADADDGCDIGAVELDGTSGSGGCGGGGDCD